MDYIKDLYAKVKAWFISVADQDGDGDVDLSHLLKHWLSISMIQNEK